MSVNRPVRGECVLEIAVAIVSHLSSLRQLSRARLINRTFHRAVSMDLGSRIRSLVTSRYVSLGDYDEFLAVLVRTDSIVTGKWAELLAGASNSWLAIQEKQRLCERWALVVACPRGCIEQWRAYLVNHRLDDCGVEETYVGGAIRYAARFCHKDMGGDIILLESETGSSMSVVVASKASHNRRAINKSHVFDLHPAATALGESIATGRDKRRPMSSCAVECTGRWLSTNVDVDLSRTARTNIPVRRPTGGALYVQYAPESIEPYGLSAWALRHVWTLKGQCQNKNCLWFSRDIKSTRSSFAPDNGFDVAQLKRKYAGMGFPTAVFYGTQVGKVECVPVPAILPLKHHYSEWDLRYDVWLECPVFADHVLYWGDLNFQQINAPNKGGARYLLCANDQTINDANENWTLYSVLKGLGVRFSPVWRGNLMILSVSAKGRVQSLCSSDVHAVNAAVYRHMRQCDFGEMKDLKGVDPIVTEPTEIITLE
ncbi:hypothetical protein K435DRAFT_862456 [Dendrothele bispora CBS 962.96]|uniref:Uncharacterized protein n=1 Tax=Dendrothele bispora (strain CBS 962.96) TaxID=1314807 RepID=A0A4V4HEU7_DENBC|nr:hypothetical protein K435DRAFT_862456 [Dendrothele bispora CBS 962.96]